jgi:hypothetical protein
MNTVKVVLALTASALLFGCPREPIQEEARRILSLPEHEQREAIGRLPPDKQLDVDIYAATSVEPPDSLALEIAPNWKSILPVLRTRMETELNDRKLSEYMMILFAVSATQCSLRNRSDILDVAATSLSRFRPPYKTTAEDQLKQISGPHKNLPPCE